jgi:hypothetical protein
MATRAFTPCCRNLCCRTTSPTRHEVTSRKDHGMTSPPFGCSVCPT